MILSKLRTFFTLIFVQPFRWFFSLSLKKKLFTAFLAVLGLFFCLILGLYLFYSSVANGVWGKIPNDAELQALKNYQASEVYSSDGVLLGRYFVENRSEAKLDEIPKHFLQALIATEDSRFYEHSGVDARSLMRVLFKSVILGKNKGGGSTLSQQLAKNIFGRKKYGWLSMPINKIREGIIANKLESLYSKEEILMLYLNTVSFGEDTYGLKTASQRFFSVDPIDLDIPQSAILVGMLKAPSNYNPRTNPDKSKERRNVVLAQMLKEKYINSNSYNKFEQLPIVLKYKRIDAHNGLAGHFRQRLQGELETLLKDLKKPDGSEYDLMTDGLKITTTLHYKLQSMAEQATISHLKTMQKSMNQQIKAEGFFRKHKDLLTSELKRTSVYKALEKKGLSDQEIMKELQIKKKRMLYVQGGEVEKMCSVVDSVSEAIATLQAGFLALDPVSGAILAWVGSPNYQYFQFDHVTSKRQAGSIFKPIVYTQAMLDGKQPCDLVSNQKVTYAQYENWSPRNANDSYEGRYSLKGALTHSVNTISVKLCMESGIRKVISLAQKMGITSELPPKPSIALGTADVSLLEMCRLYSVFASGGSLPKLQSIVSVTDKSGRILYQKKTEIQVIISKEMSTNMTSMLASVVDSGTAFRLKYTYGCRGNIAGKTGTTQDHRDAWFIGYTPTILAGVWVGADHPEVHFNDMELGEGARLAMPIWAKFYQKIQAANVYKTNTPISFPDKALNDCDLYVKDNFFQKLFGRKNKTNKKTGLEENEELESGKKKKKRWWRKD